MVGFLQAKYNLSYEIEDDEQRIELRNTIFSVFTTSMIMALENNTLNIANFEVIFLYKKKDVLGIYN